MRRILGFVIADDRRLLRNDFDFDFDYDYDYEHEHEREREQEKEQPHHARPWRSRIPVRVSGIVIAIGRQRSTAPRSGTDGRSNPTFR
jgi:hypothetical protein